jgi:hypothetical protein
VADHLSPKSHPQNTLAQMVSGMWLIIYPQSHPKTHEQDGERHVADHLSPPSHPKTH